MASTEDLIKEYLRQIRVIQVATTSGGRPWICTVYAVEDNQANLYWLSLPTRRHSQELAENPRVAIAAAIKHDQPVIGLQAEGVVDAVDDRKIIRQIMERYAERHNTGRQFYENFVAGTNQHVMYRFQPEQYWLFDEQTFGDGVRREWNITKGE